MTVIELIKHLLDECMDDVVTIEVWDDGERTSIYVDGLAEKPIHSHETALVADKKLRLL